MTMRTTRLFPICFTLLMCACRQQEPVNQLKEINNALEKANSIIDDNNKLAYEEMNGKLHDPHTYYQATIWEPKALIARRCATEVKMLIESLKSTLIKQSDSLKYEDHAIVRQLLSANGDKLYEKLVLLNDSLANVFDRKEFINSSVIANELNRDSVFFYNHVLQTDVMRYSKETWLNISFSDVSPRLAIMTLNKIKADVISAENFLVNYCNMKIVYNFCGYFMPSPIASLSNSVVKSGDTIMITAGVGVFSKEMSPRISINGIQIKLREYPLANYEFTATGKPGTYNVPVKIEYTDSDGSRKAASRVLRYIITE